MTFRHFLTSAWGVLLLPGIAYGLYSSLVRPMMGGEFSDAFSGLSILVFLIGFGLGLPVGIALLPMYALWRLLSTPAVERSPHFFYHMYFTVVGLTLCIFVAAHLMIY